MKPLEDLLVPGTRVGGRYVIERRLGGGAMGAVYAATGPDGARVAIKALMHASSKGDAAERRARFTREASVCATLVHPNVVPVVDHGIDEALGLPFLVMPLLDGEDLAAVLDRVGMLEPDVAIALAVQACEGLAAAHARGVVHRDVKPSNLFLQSRTDVESARSTESGLEHQTSRIVVMVSDFGLAKSLDQAPGSPGALTGTGRFMGTPQYVSPEQAISAKHVDLRTDVYGLAMSLYHALCGKPAFAHVPSFMGLVLELTAREAPHLQAAAPWVPPAVARIVHAALLRDPAARCPSAGELALALDMAVGIDASRRAVTRADLRTVSDATKATLSPRAQLASSWEELLRN